MASTITIDGVKLRIPVREPQPPVREDYRNAAQFCQAEREFLGEQAFREKYGTGNLANALRQVRQQQPLTGLASRPESPRKAVSDCRGGR